MFSSPNTRPSLADALKRESVFADIGLQDDGSISSSGLVTLSSPSKVDLEAAGGGTTKKTKARNKPQPQLLGTLSGVFLPCVQNILGVILFLRLPYITAQAGVFHTSAIILICVSSTLLTALSLSAIGTNGCVMAGGPYYVISRVLGREIGGSIGILFYLGTTIASSMYVLGAIEAIQSGFQLGELFPFDTQALALVLMAIVAGTVAVGVKYVNRGAVIFLAIVLISVFCLLLGCILFSAGKFEGEIDASAKKYGDNMTPYYGVDPDNGKTTFLGLLALFYPSVTGIMAGSNRSAVLADPSRSIPKGTLSAIGVTTFLYLTVVWLFGSTLSRETLLNDKLIVTAVAWPAGVVVRVGIVMSSVGAALQCMAGAPRLLAAIAADECIGFLKCLKPPTESANPTRAILVSWVIASIPCLAGNLDAITPLITLFFLAMYAGINLSCFILGLLKAPSFRPTFRCFHWSTSLLGFLWCIGLAFTIDYAVTLGTIALTGVLFAYILQGKKAKGANNNGNGDFGDIVQGIRFVWCHSLLDRMVENDAVHAKNYRPYILGLIKADQHGILADSTSLIRLCAQLNKGRGMTMLMAIMNGSIHDGESNEASLNAKIEMQKQIAVEKLKVFPPDVVLTSNPNEAVGILARHGGIGPLRPNTVLLSWPEDAVGNPQACTDLTTSLRYLVEARRTILMLKSGESFPGNLERVGKHERNETIDVFWLCHDGGLLLLLPFLLSRNATWRGAKLRLFAGVTSPIVSDLDRFKGAIQQHLKRARIEAEVEVVDLSHLHNATGIVEAPPIHSDADSDSVEGTLLCQLLSPEKTNLFSARPTSPKSTDCKVLQNMECSLDRSDDTRSTETEQPETPRQRLTFADSEDEKNATARDDDHSTSLDCVVGAISSSDQSAAILLNEAIRRHSTDKARLVVTNLPLLRPDTSPVQFVNFVDTMTRDIDNVLLVRGSGNEVITQYA